MRKVIILLGIILCWLPAIMLGEQYGELRVDAYTTALWHFNGNADDETGVHNGTINGSVALTNGYFGQAYDFPGGTNDYINFTDHSDFTFDETEDYTWEFWVYPDDLDTEWRCLWGQTYDTSNYIIIYIGWTDNGYWGPYTDSVSAGIRYGSNRLYTHAEDSILTEAAWAYIVITYDASQSQVDRFMIYVNGIDQTDTGDIYSSGTIADVNPSAIYIGGNAIWDERTDGIIEEVRFSNRLLSSKEIRQIYAMQKGAYGIH